MPPRIGRRLAEIHQQPAVRRPSRAFYQEIPRQEALARAVGEYGSVIFIAGNLPFISEIAPLLIIIRLEEFGYAQAAAIGTAMLMISFGILLLVHLVQAWQRRRFGR